MAEGLYDVISIGELDRLDTHSGSVTQFTFPWSAGYDPGGAPRRIHPTELQRRRARCEPIVSRLLKTGRKFIAACNLCGSERRAVVAQPDRYGFPIRTVMCLECGLYYLADRLTDDGYAAFYANDYRKITSLFTGDQRSDINDIHTDQVPYAKGLIRSLEGFVNFRPGARAIDVGGSGGQVALEFQKHFGLSAMVLDPAADEVAAARELGLEGVTGSFEAFETNESFDLILFCRSIEHVQDLHAVLSKMRRMLRPGGVLFCDIVDFTELCRLVGHPEAVTKIDHCFWLTQETATRVFRSVGLQILMVDVSFKQPLTGFLLRACEPSFSPPADPQLIEAQLRSHQRRASEWQELGRTPVDAKDWVRHKAYRLKRRLLS
jgi:SAM-dependent methyltransferase